MALRAGYYGLKKRVAGVLTNLAAELDGAVIIKSIGTGLLFNTTTGELSSDSTPSTETKVDLSALDVNYIENPSVMSIVNTEDSLTFEYGSGSQIGARAGKLLDVTLLDFIKMSINVSSIYSSDFPAKVGIATTITNAQNGNYITSISKNVTDGDVDIMLDVRGLNGNMYLVLDGSGDDVVFSNVKTISQYAAVDSKTVKKTRKK